MSGYGNFKGGRPALLIIDSQRLHVDPDFNDPAFMSWGVDSGLQKPNGTAETRATAERCRDLAEEARGAGVPVFIVYYAFDDEDLASANGGLYMVEYKPERGDVLVPKDEMSVFQGSDLDVYLKKRGIGTLFLAGFHASRCITDSAMDGVDLGYKVKLVEECIGENDPHSDIAVSRALGALEAYGAERVTAAQAISAMRRVPHGVHHGDFEPEIIEPA